jgi:hypothetical protein
MGKKIKLDDDSKNKNIGRTRQHRGHNFISRKKMKAIYKNSILYISLFNLKACVKYIKINDNKQWFTILLYFLYYKLLRPH